MSKSHGKIQRILHACATSFTAPIEATDTNIKLETYLAIIPNANCDQFDICLDRLSTESGVRANRRLSSIIPCNSVVAYEVDLTDDEAIVLALSAPGQYLHKGDKNIREREFMMAYLQEPEIK